MLQLSEFCDLFITLGFSSSTHKINVAQKFATFLYTKSSAAEGIDECRYTMFKSGCPIQKLPPSLAALQQHTRRAIYQAEVWKANLEKAQNLPSSLNWDSTHNELDPTDFIMDESATSISVINDSRHHLSLQLQIQNLPLTMFLQKKV